MNIILTVKERRAMVRAMCGQKVVDRKPTEEQMDMLGLKETIDRLATANGVRWYGHVLRRDDDSVLRVALNLEVSGKRKRGRPKTWKKQVEEETEKIGLKEDALRRDKWRDRVRAIAEGMGYIRPSLLKGQHWIKTESHTHTKIKLFYFKTNSLKLLLSSINGPASQVVNLFKLLVNIHLRII